MRLMRDESLVEELADLLPDTITVEPWLSRDVHNQDAYGAAVTVHVYVEGKTRAVRTVKGEEAVSSAAIYGTTGLSTDDRITLPARFSPRMPPILYIDRRTDEFGNPVEVVYV